MGNKELGAAKRPGIYGVMNAGEGPEMIEKKSLAAIDRKATRHSYNPDQWHVVRRMIHATADFGLLDITRFFTGRHIGSRRGT